MTTHLWPCSQCGAPGVKNVGAHGYCGTHLTALLDMFSRENLNHFGGIGLVRGGARPELGAGVFGLECSACGATWSGVPGTRCQYCRRQLEHLIAAERARVLTVPEITENEPADVTFQKWGERLRHAVEAGVLLKDEAERAFRRAVRHVA